MSHSLYFGKHKQSWTVLMLIVIVCVVNLTSANGDGERLSKSNTITEMVPTKLPTINDEIIKNKDNSDDKIMEKTTRPSMMDVDNEYHSMSRAFDIFNEKMELFMSFYMNEMNLLRLTLTDLKEKVQTIDIIHHEVDQLIEHRNIIDQKLNVMQETTIGDQSVNNKLERMEYALQHLRVRIDEFTADKQQYPDGRTGSKEKDGEGSVLNNGEQLTNCESKIDHLISFVHNFAELDRIESSDILNRLGNMQSQMIHFFDTKETAKHRAKANSELGSHDERNGTKLSFEAETNVTSYTDSSINVISAAVNPIPINMTQVENENMKNKTNFNLLQPRKRKRSRSKRNRSDDTECELKLWRCRNEHFSPSTHTEENDDVDVDYTLMNSNKNAAKANYGAPSPHGCHQFVNSTEPNGVYQFDGIPATFTTSGFLFNQRQCVFVQRGVGWTVIQSRGSIRSGFQPLNFNRSWIEYKNGFGNLDSEFWYGNDFIHRLTYDDDMELRIELESWDNRRIAFEYDVFRVDSEENRYNLFVSGFRDGDASMDALKYHHNQDFSTFDRQNDKSGIDDRQACCSCAKSYASGWWFNNCIEANLNGIYQFNPRNNSYVGIIWEHWLGDYSLKLSKMLIRPKITWPTHNHERGSNARPPDDP